MLLFVCLGPLFKSVLTKIVLDIRVKIIDEFFVSFYLCPLCIRILIGKDLVFMASQWGAAIFAIQFYQIRHFQICCHSWLPMLATISFPALYVIFVDYSGACAGAVRVR